MDSLALTLAHPEGIVAPSGGVSGPIDNSCVKDVVAFHLRAVELDAQCVLAAIGGLRPESVDVQLEASRRFKVNALRAVTGLVCRTGSVASGSGCGSTVSGVSSVGSMGSSALRGMLRARRAGSQVALARLPSGVCYLKVARGEHAEDLHKRAREWPNVAKLLASPRAWFADAAVIEKHSVVGEGALRHVTAKPGSSLIGLFHEAAAGRAWPGGSLGEWCNTVRPNASKGSDELLSVKLGGDYGVDVGQGVAGAFEGCRHLPADVCCILAALGEPGVVSRSYGYRSVDVALNDIEVAVYCQNEQPRVVAMTDVGAEELSELGFSSVDTIDTVTSRVEAVLLYCGGMGGTSEAEARVLARKAFRLHSVSTLVWFRGGSVAEPSVRVFSEAVGGAKARSLAVLDGMKHCSCDDDDFVEVGVESKVGFELGAGVAGGLSPVRTRESLLWEFVVPEVRAKWKRQLSGTPYVLGFLSAVPYSDVAWDVAEGYRMVRKGRSRWAVEKGDGPGLGVKEYLMRAAARIGSGRLKYLGDVYRMPIVESLSSGLGHDSDDRIE